MAKGIRFSLHVLSARRSPRGASLLLLIWAAAVDSGQAQVQAGPALPEQASPEQRRTELDLRLMAFLMEDHAERHGSVPDSGKLRPIHELLAQLPDDYAQRFPRRDAWGNEYQYISSRGQFGFASTGPNGRPDAILELLLDPPESFDGPRPRAQSLGDDLIQQGQELLTSAGFERGAQKRTMADLRSIATAMEEYAIDNSEYPPDTGGLVDVGVMEPYLSPIYVRRLPLEDAWGERIQVWSTGATYLLVSSGADRLLDQEYAGGSPGDVPAVGAFRDPARDILFAAGSFIQWPEGTQAD